ncbi:MAG: HAMP domain-containing histidine kinase [Rubrobacter sp.]|nr:HAMP domain-containing histidine kinase [Rubrobacter sp.]
MFESIRRRLTLSYIGIFALILVLLGAVAVASFAHQTASQQDELLEQKAQGISDYVRGPLLRDYQAGRDPGGLNHRDKNGEPTGPFQVATDPDTGVVALVPGKAGDANGEEGTILDSSPSSSSLGLPFEEQARRVAESGGTVRETVEGPGGEKMRVVSVLVSGPGGESAVIQSAQPRRVVWEAVGNLILILVPVGLGGLLLAGMGGLYMSRRAMEPVRESFQRQRTFIADASHELKTPLALVRINAEVMKRSPTDPDNEEIVEDLLSEIDRMDTLLSDLLVLARLDAGKLEVENKPFDLATVAAETAGRFLKRASEEGVRLEVEVPDELPVHGDSQRTEQILAALLDNAARYTPKDGTITVSGRLPDGWAEVSVKDNGPGISPKHLPRIFDRFYRVEEARTRKGGGTGLGLSIARDLARAQGGELIARDSKSGANFMLRLPKHED